MSIKRQMILKRCIDIVISLLALLFLGIPMLLLILTIYLRTGESGVFRQKRVGEKGNIFCILKIKSFYKNNIFHEYASFLRRSKLDELPQLINILRGEMSLVGPRPDIVGFADELIGEERIILKVKPGLTGPASLFFYNEEYILSKQIDKEKYNKEVIWRKKVEINMIYVQNYSLKKDIKYICLSMLLLVNFNKKLEL